MDNVLGTQGVPLTVFGGAVPELSPEDLPEGASPFNQDCDFNPGSVFTRGGRSNQTYFLNSWVEDLTQFAQSVPGPNAPNEVPWTNPPNATQNVPGTYTIAALQDSVSLNAQGIVSQDGPVSSAGGTGTAVSAPALTPASGNTDWGLYLISLRDNSNVTGVGAGWTSLFSQIGTSPNDVYTQTSAATMTPTATSASSQVWANCLALFKLKSPSPPMLSAHATSTFGQNVTIGPYTPTSQGNVLFITLQMNSPVGAIGGNAGVTPYTVQSPDSAGNVWVKVAEAGVGTFAYAAIWAAYNISGAAVTINVTSANNPTQVGGTWCLFEAQGQWALVNGPVGIDPGKVSTGSGLSTAATAPSLTPSGNDFALFCVCPINGTSVTPGGAWSTLDNGIMQQVTNAAVAGQATVPNNNWASAMVLFTLAGSLTTPTQRQGRSVLSGGLGGSANNLAYGSAVNKNDLLFSVIKVGNNGGGATGLNSLNLHDTLGNTWIKCGDSTSGNAEIHLYYAFANATGALTVTTPACGNFTFGEWYLYDFIGGIGLQVLEPFSQKLICNNFVPAVPATSSVLGFEVEISGNQSSQDPSAFLNVSLTNPAVGGSPTFLGQLPASNGTAVFATPISNWNLPLTPALLNNPNFGVQIYAQSGVTCDFSIYAVKLKVFFAAKPANFDWIQTYEQTDGEVDTLGLDAAGLLWTENATVSPGGFSLIFGNILPNTFAKGVAFADIEYIAFSNLLNGTDIPRQWNNSNFDRISMVGPGNAPSVASSGGSGGGNTAIQTITQYPQVMIRRIAWGTVNSPNDSTPGNLLVIFGEGRTGANTYASLNPYNATFGAGTTVVLSNITNPFPRKGGGTLPYNINGTYAVGQVTTGIVGGAESCPIFTVPSPTTIWAYSDDFGSAGPPPTSNWFYQSCLATVTLQAPLPNVGVGSSIQITGTGGSPPSGYDGTWTVLQAPNASSMTINSCQLTGGVATYSFTLLAGSAAPTVGQIVTTQNCLNGSGIATPGVFNGTFTIASVSGSTFSVAIGQPDIPLQNEVGNVPQPTASVGGTIFVFDAGQIVGSKTGGNIVGQGQVGVGVRQVAYSFLTRSGYITQPSKIATFNVTSGSGAIQVSNLATGPPNVVARIVSFTGANGGNFFYIPQEVDLTIGGVLQKNSSTIVNDNTSTSATFSFSDAVLLSATAIDIQGNNLFNTIELGSCRGLLTYASRMFAWSEQNKITNLRNLSFDGGTLPGNPAPLGWALDATNGTGGSLNFSSPVFGWGYQIQNVSGITQASYGMLTQGAALDEFGVAIVQASTLYSVRITAQANPVPASGNLVVDLFSPGTGGGTVLGSFTLPLGSMTTSMQIYTGTLLTTILQPVPKDLVLRIWAQNIPTGTTVLIDRVEPFPTLAPSNTTAFKVSYANNQEAFDLLTGVCGPAQNMQPINGAMELFDLLYALKERSWFSTFDNGVTEPFKWNWKEVSNKIGTIGINSYDWGEGWALTGNRQGVHFFEGGEPIKVSQEIQPLWDLINWQYGYTMWVRNDPEQKRFMVGVPIPTPNIYMPEFPANANPTSPNVILMCNYRELNTGSALAQTGPIRSTYTGRLMSPEPARKWSFWNIACPYSDYIDRGNNQWPQWFCSGYGDSKNFALAASQLSDDGLAINSFWVSYGFVKPEAQDAKGLGLYRMEFPYFTVLATGIGTLLPFVYPESPQNQPYVLDPTPLPAISQGDLEIGVNIKGQRFFVRVGTNAVGSAFRVSKMVVPLLADPWSPIRGSNAVMA